jgi:hypothetical protein
MTLHSAKNASNNGCGSGALVVKTTPVGGVTRPVAVPVPEVRS